MAICPKGRWEADWLPYLPKTGPSYRPPVVVLKRGRATAHRSRTAKPILLQVSPFSFFFSKTCLCFGHLPIQTDLIFCKPVKSGRVLAENQADCYPLCIFRQDKQKKGYPAGVFPQDSTKTPSSCGQNTFLAVFWLKIRPIGRSEGGLAGSERICRH